MLCNSVPLHVPIDLRPLPYGFPEGSQVLDGLKDRGGRMTFTGLPNCGASFVAFLAKPFKGLFVTFHLFTPGLTILLIRFFPTLVNEAS